MDFKLIEGLNQLNHHFLYDLTEFTCLLSLQLIHRASYIREGMESLFTQQTDYISNDDSCFGKNLCRFISAINSTEFLFSQRCKWLKEVLVM